MLTDRQVKALEPAPTRYLKTDEKGLCIDVLPSGVKSFVYRYRLNGKQQKTQLGQYPALSLKAARDERDRLAQLVKAGTDPAGEKRKKKLQAKTGASTNPTVREFCDRYYRERVEGKLKDPAQVRRYIDKEICCPALADKPLREVTGTDIENLIDLKTGAKKVRTALHIHGILKRIFDYAVYRKIALSNPAESIKAEFIGTTTARTRALSPNEVRIFLRTVDDADIMRQFKIALRLLLLTMVRKSELLHARWDQVDLEARLWSLPGAATKTGEPHAVFLSAQVIDLFLELKVFACGSELILPGKNPRKPLAGNTLNSALDRLTFVGVAPFTIHDMRRTSSTILNDNGFSGDAIEAALGHAVPGIRGIYNKSTYAAERKRMLQWWADYVDATVDGGKVLIGNFG